MIYRYEAISPSGERIEGFHQGANEAEVASMLKNNNYIVLKIEEDVEKAKSIDLFSKKVTKKDIAVFCRQFFTMLDAGIGVVESIDILNKQSENKSLAKALENIHEDVQKGQSLSASMAKEGKIFPKLLINMVEAGEASGNLDVIMERMAVHYEKENKLENKIKSAMTYPIVLAFVSIGVVIFLLVAVMPTFIGMFDSSGQSLPGPTLVILKISDSLTGYWYLYLGLVLGLGLVIKILKESESGRNGIDRLKLRLPVFKDTNVKIITSRFTRTLSTLISSGIPLLEAIDIVSSVVGNYVVEKKLKESTKDIQRGVPLSRATEEVGVFPPMVYSMIRIGEESGAIDDILFKTADFYDEEVEFALERMASLMEPLMIVIMAIIIGFIVIAMALPMFDVINTI